MNLHPHPKTPAEFYFNFCHSSTLTQMDILSKQHTRDHSRDACVL